MNKAEAVNAFRDKSPVMMMHRISAGERKDLEYDCISAVILRHARTGHEIIQVELMDKKANSITVTKPEYVYLKGEDAPSFPKDDELPHIKYKCGTYKNVLLSSFELDKLEKLFPDTYKQIINEVSEELVSGEEYKNHYAAVVKKIQV